MVFGDDGGAAVALQTHLPPGRSAEYIISIKNNLLARRAWEEGEGFDSWSSCQDNQPCAAPSLQQSAPSKGGEKGNVLVPWVRVPPCPGGGILQDGGLTS